MARNIQVVRVPHNVAVPVNEIPAPEWTDVSTKVAALSHNTFDPVAYGAVRDDPGAATANVTAIQTAADNARNAGGTLILKGTYWINATITLRCHVDGTSGTIKTGTADIAPAVRVGSVTSGDRTHNLHVILPIIRQENKGGLGWSGLDTGLELANLYSCHITIADVGNFSTGIKATARGAGNVYNNIYLGILENNKVGLLVTTEDSTGWCNENVWVGGRFIINSAEGTNIPGAAHIRIGRNGYTNNNHLFLKPSVEGEGPQYALDLDGAYITVVQGRYEATTPRVRLGANTNGVSLLHGWGLERVAYTVEPGGGLNSVVQHRQHHRFMGGGGAAGVLAVANTSSDAQPALAVLGTGANPATDTSTAYSVAIGANESGFKAPEDAFPRIRIAHKQGQILGGNGTAASTTYLRPFGANNDWQTNRKVLAAEGIGVGNSTTASSMGTLVRKVQVFDANGNSLGYIPIHSS